MRIYYDFQNDVFALVKRHGGVKTCFWCTFGTPIQTRKLIHPFWTDLLQLCEKEGVNVLPLELHKMLKRDPSDTEGCGRRNALFSQQFYDTVWLLWLLKPIRQTTE